MDPALRRF